MAWVGAARMTHRERGGEAAPERRGFPKAEKTHEPADGYLLLFRGETGVKLNFRKRGFFWAAARLVMVCKRVSALREFQPPQSSLHKLSRHVRAFVRACVRAVERSN